MLDAKFLNDADFLEKKHIVHERNGLLVRGQDVFGVVGPKTLELHQLEAPFQQERGQTLKVHEVLRRRGERLLRHVDGVAHGHRVAFELRLRVALRYGELVQDKAVVLFDVAQQREEVLPVPGGAHKVAARRGARGDVVDELGQLRHRFEHVVHAEHAAHDLERRVVVRGQVRVLLHALFRDLSEHPAHDQLVQFSRRRREVEQRFRSVPHRKERAHRTFVRRQVPDASAVLAVRNVVPVQIDPKDEIQLEVAPAAQIAGLPHPKIEQVERRRRRFLVQEVDDLFEQPHLHVPMEGPEAHERLLVADVVLVLRERSVAADDLVRDGELDGVPIVVRRYERVGGILIGAHFQRLPLPKLALLRVVHELHDVPRLDHAAVRAHHVAVHHVEVAEVRRRVLFGHERPDAFLARGAVRNLLEQRRLRQGPVFAAAAEDVQDHEVLVPERFVDLDQEIDGGQRRRLPFEVEVPRVGAVRRRHAGRRDPDPFVERREDEAVGRVRNLGRQALGARVEDALVLVKGFRSDAVLHERFQHLHRLFHLLQPRVELEHPAILSFEKVNVEHRVEHAVDELAVQQRPFQREAGAVGVFHAEPRRQEEELPRRPYKQKFAASVGLVRYGVALKDADPVVLEVGLLPVKLLGLERLEGRLSKVLELQRHRVGAHELLVQRQARVDLAQLAVLVRHGGDLLVRHWVGGPLKPPEDARADLFQLLHHFHRRVVRARQSFGFDLAHLRRRE